MADLNGLTIWTDAYLGDTRHLSTLEHGAYFLLLLCAWRSPSNDLPDDDKLLARICGLRIDRWQRLRPVIMAFWTQRANGRWAQKRLDKEKIWTLTKGEKMSLNAKAKWLKSQETAYAEADAIAYAPVPVPVSAPVEGSKNPPVTFGDIPLGDRPKKGLGNGLERSDEGSGANSHRADPESSAGEKPARKRAASASAGGTRLPADWRCGEAGHRYAESRGLDPGETSEAFRDYWVAANGSTSLKRDWDAAFRTWCRRASQPGGYTNGLGGARPGPRSGGPASVVEAGRRVLAARLRQRDGGDGV